MLMLINADAYTKITNDNNIYIIHTHKLTHIYAYKYMNI